MKLIPLTEMNRKAIPKFFAMVDDEDYDELIKYKWHAENKVNTSANTVYAVRTITIGKKDTKVRMHRQILNAPKGMLVDHGDGNGLNNQKYNIRICTHSQNSSNRVASRTSSSKYTGVHWDKSCNKWRTEIRKHGKRQFSKLFLDEKEAARCYNENAPRFHGEFAKINVID